MRLLIALFSVVFLSTTAHSEIVQSPTTWSVEPNFGKGKDARHEISGAACVPGTQRCIVVNDEKKYAQFFDIDNDKILPGKIVRLLPDTINGEEMKEIDAEGAAYASPCLYVSGSHGRGRKGKLRPSAFYLFCVPVDPIDGQPNFPFESDELSPHILRSGFLRQTIRENEDLASFAEKQLDMQGVSIEGLAALDGQLFFGLRSPSVDGNALLFGVDLDDIFRGTAPLARVHRVPLGENTGVRDLAAVSNGILILAARSDDAPNDEDGDEAPLPTVWLWDVSHDGRAQNLGILPNISTTDKPETLLVLEETEELYRVLIMFDGVKNGGPTEFSIEK